MSVLQNPWCISPKASSFSNQEILRKIQDLVAKGIKFHKSSITIAESILLPLTMDQTLR